MPEAPPDQIPNLLQIRHPTVGHYFPLPAIVRKAAMAKPNHEPKTNVMMWVMLLPPYGSILPMLRSAPAPFSEQAMYWKVALVAPAIGVSVQ